MKDTVVVVLAITSDLRGFVAWLGVGVWFLVLFVTLARRGRRA